jgi:MFS family permease
MAVVTAERGDRDLAIISLVGAAHYSSHVLQLALPPLFPILHKEFGVGFTELGAFVTLFYVSSGLGQAAAGVLVDRYGAYRLLTMGLAYFSDGAGSTLYRDLGAVRGDELLSVSLALVGVVLNFAAIGSKSGLSEQANPVNLPVFG